MSAPIVGHLQARPSRPANRVFRRSRRHVLACESLEDRRLLSAVPALVANLDLNYVSFGSNDSYLNTVQMDGALYFAASDGLQQGLWRSDGTADGTSFVKQVYPHSDAESRQFLTVSNGVLYFTAYDAAHGAELWRSDGTESGTSMLKDVQTYPFNLPNLGSNPRHLTDVNGTLYFTVNTYESNYEINGLWKSDGTADGTVQVRYFEADAIQDPIAANGLLYFWTYHGPGEFALWRSDGTEAGTVELERFDTLDMTTTRTAIAGDYLYFVADDGIHGRELWRTDGSLAGTALVADIQDGATGSDPAFLTTVGQVLYVSANDGMTGPELWKSEVANGATSRVKDIEPGAGGSWPGPMVAVGDTLYFAAEDTEGGWELWSSDGSEGSTRRVRDIVAGAEGSYVEYLTNVNGLLVFTAWFWDEAAQEWNSQLWRGDGSEAGTVLVYDFAASAPGIQPIWPYYGGQWPSLVQFEGVLYFQTYNVSPPYRSFWSLPLNPVTTTTVDASATSALEGQVLNVTASVAPVSAAGGTPTGTVSFRDGERELAQVPLDADGRATFSTAALAAGTYEISAVFLGDGVVFHSTSRSAALDLTIDAITPENLGLALEAATTEKGAISLQVPSTDPAAATQRLEEFLAALAALNVPAQTVGTIDLDLGGASITTTPTILVPEGVTLQIASTTPTTLGGVAVAGGTVVVGAGVTPTQWTVSGGAVELLGELEAPQWTIAGGSVTYAYAGETHVILDHWTVSAGTVDIQGQVELPGLDVSGGSVTLNGVVLLPGSPALTVSGGQVVLHGVTAYGGSSETIRVTGGRLTLRDSRIEESASADAAAIRVLGGTVDLGTEADPGNNVLNVKGAGLLVDNTTPSRVSAVGTSFTIDDFPLAMSSLSGLVFADFNNDGEVDFGEQGIPGVAITLEGSDFLGPVHRSLLTDDDGAYNILNLLPGSYRLFETQPAGYTQGTNRVGNGGGTVSGDQFVLELVQGLDALNYNYGERPEAAGAVQQGQTAGIGFWNNRHGQNLIRNLNGGPTSTRLGDWLAATFPNTFGVYAAAGNLADKDNAFIATFFQSRFILKGEKLDAQLLATALAVYVTNETLSALDTAPGSTPIAARYGFLVSGFGVGTATFNVGTNGDAFGVANGTVMTVLDLLLAADAQADSGVLYGGKAARRRKANAVFGAINQSGGI